MIVSEGDSFKMEGVNKMTEEKTEEKKEKIKEQKSEAVEQQDNIEEKDLGDILEQITPFVEKFAPIVIEYHKIKAPHIKRHQWINFIIMMAILASVSLLAYYKIIDGSAATGLIGTVIGYVFGGLYRQKD